MNRCPGGLRVTAYRGYLSSLGRVPKEHLHRVGGYACRKEGKEEEVSFLGENLCRQSAGEHHVYLAKGDKPIVSKMQTEGFLQREGMKVRGGGRGRKLKDATRSDVRESENTPKRVTWRGC